MRFRHLAEQIYLRPWFITTEAHTSIRMIFERAMNGTLPRADDGFALSDFIPQRKQMVVGADGIADIHILGPLGKGLSKIEQSCGCTGFEQIEDDYAQAIAGGARGVLLHINSPGGTVTGTPECAQMIADCPIPTVAFTDDMCASAAYYLASGASAIVASQSAAVGSIGVYIPWMDASARYAAAGLKPDPIVNTGGDLKALGFGGKLSDAQRSYLQQQVDEDFAAFKGHVLTYRAIEDGAMRGQCLGGKSALAANLIDCVGSMADARRMLAAKLS